MPKRKKWRWLHVPSWVVLVLAVTFLLRIPSFFEPYYYGDEMVSLTIGNGMRQGLALYSRIHGNNPPLFYVLGAIAGSVFWFRVILAFWMLATTVVFWKFMDTLFPKSPRITMFGVWVFGLLTTLPLLEGLRPNVELFMIGPTIFAFYFFMSRKNTPKTLFVTGLAMFISILFSVSAIFDIGAIIFLWIITTKTTKKGSYSLFGLTLSKEFIFVSVWLFLSLIAATISEQSNPHLLLQAVAPAAILIGILIARKSIEQSLAIVPLFFLVFVPVYFNFGYFPTSEYYTGFINFATQEISREEYFNSFGKGVNRNYKIAEFLLSSSAPGDHIFVWGDSAPVYALSRRVPSIRYVTAQDISDFSNNEEVLDLLHISPPAYVVILPGGGPFLELQSFVASNYLLIDSTTDAQIWRLMGADSANALR